MAADWTSALNRARDHAPFLARALERRPELAELMAGGDGEAALRAANDKFERRYRGMEALAEGEFAKLDLDAQEALWQAVKRAEKER